MYTLTDVVPTLSAAENVESARIPLGMGRAQRRRRVTAALDSVGLGDRVRHLSIRQDTRRTAR